MMKPRAMAASQVETVMKNQIIIHASGKQNRIALIENGELAQLFIESPENQRTVGDIYLAEVHKVMSGIRAAFIDVGAQKDAFLHFSDAGEHLEDYLVMLNGRENVPKPGTEDKKSGNGENFKSEDPNHAGTLLQPKQKVLVQIVKEPIGSKTLVERHNLGVSSATVRNDMAVLEAEGYIAQPPTAARFKTGNVPGSAMSTADACVLGGAPKSVEAPEKALLRVRSWTCVSMPTTISQPLTAGARSCRADR
jgi:hypothetical protein